MTSTAMIAATYMSVPNMSTTYASVASLSLHAAFMHGLTCARTVRSEHADGGSGSRRTLAAWGRRIIHAGRETVRRQTLRRAAEHVDDRAMFGTGANAFDSQG